MAAPVTEWDGVPVELQVGELVAGAVLDTDGDSDGEGDCAEAGLKCSALDTRSSSSEMPAGVETRTIFNRNCKDWTQAPKNVKCLTRVRVRGFDQSNFS